MFGAYFPVPRERQDGFPLAPAGARRCVLPAALTTPSARIREIEHVADEATEGGGFAAEQLAEHYEKVAAIFGTDRIPEIISTYDERGRVDPEIWHVTEQILKTRATTARPECWTR